VRAAVFVIGTVAFTLAVGWLSWRTGQWLRTRRLDGNPLLPIPELVGRLVMIAICLGLGRLSGLPPESLGWAPSEPLGDLGWGLALGALAQLVLNPLTVSAVRRWGWRVYSPVLVRSLLPRTPAEWVAVPLAMVPGVVFEELLFRSLWVGGMSGLASPGFLNGVVPWIVAGLAAVLYGALHAVQGPLGAVAAAGIGYGLAALFLWRGSLLAPLAAHLVYNWLQLWTAHRQREWLMSFEPAMGRDDDRSIS
jgi:membrane protease YdiL (CAAX protease family)